MLPHFIQEMMSHLGCNLTCTLKNYKVSEMLPFTVMKKTCSLIPRNGIGNKKKDCQKEKDEYFSFRSEISGFYIR